jgi:hypothetical protein
MVNLKQIDKVQVKPIGSSKLNGNHTKVINIHWDQFKLHFTLIMPQKLYYIFLTYNENMFRIRPANILAISHIR